MRNKDAPMRVFGYRSKKPRLQEYGTWRVKMRLVSGFFLLERSRRATVGAATYHAQHVSLARFVLRPCVAIYRSILTRIKKAR